MSHPGEREPDLTDANQPSKNVHLRACGEVGAPRVNHRQALVHRIDGAQHTPLCVDLQAAQDEVKETAAGFALNEIEPTEHGYRQREPRGGNPDHGVVRAERDQHRQAQRREEEQGCCLNQHVDDNAGGGERAGNSPKGQQSRTDKVPGDLGKRQQAIDRFADESG